jgi:hypothetical protein
VIPLEDYEMDLVINSRLDIIGRFDVIVRSQPPSPSLPPPTTAFLRFFLFRKPTVTLLHRTAPSSLQPTGSCGTGGLLPLAASRAPQPLALLRPASLLGLPLPAGGAREEASGGTGEFNSNRLDLTRTSRPPPRLRLLHAPLSRRPPAHSNVDLRV